MVPGEWFVHALSPYHTYPCSQLANLQFSGGRFVFHPGLGRECCAGRSVELGPGDHAGVCVRGGGEEGLNCRQYGIAGKLSAWLPAMQVFVPEDTSKTSFARMILDKSW